MGRYVVCKSPVVRLDLMVKKELYPQLVSYIQRTGCTYEKEDTAKIKQGGKGEWVCLKNIDGPKGFAIGELLGLFYSLEWGNLIEGKDDKFYIIINAKKKRRKKHVCEDREETGAGSEGGDSGEPDKPAEPGPVAGYCGKCADTGFAGFDDPGEQPGLPDTCDGRCE